jgi:hypothetical protein
LLLDYTSQSPAGRLVNGEKVELEEDEEWINSMKKRQKIIA